MMTRSGYCYGPIPQTWHKQISELLAEIRESLGPLESGRPFPIFECWDQTFRLEKLIELRREDIFWITALSERLLTLREKLSKMKEDWVAGTVWKIDNLIHEIRG
jgi:hypothetical protein